MKKISFFLINLLFSIAVLSQSSVWKIEKSGATIYLGGTVHILRAEDYPLPTEFDKAYKKSDILVFETDLEKIESPEIATKLIMKSMLEEGDSLSNILSEAVYQKLESKIAEKGMTIKVFETMRPSIVVLTISSLDMQQMEMQAEGVDQYFFKKAKSEEKSVSYLETIEEQIDLITMMGEGHEDEFVLKSLEDLKDMETGLSQLISDWKNGTNKVMLEELNKMKSDYPDVYNSLLYERNQNWIKKIEKMFKNESIEFVLVGNLHLYGEDGLLNLLKLGGYKVSQL